MSDKKQSENIDRSDDHHTTEVSDVHKDTPVAAVPPLESGDSAQKVKKSAQSFSSNGRGLKMIILGVLIVLLIAGVGVYEYAVHGVQTLSKNPTTVVLAGYFNLPIASVDGHPISYTEYMTDLNSLTKFYSSKPPNFPSMTPKQISDQVLSRLFVNSIVSKVAKKLNVTVKQSEIDKAKETLSKSFPTPQKEEQKMESTFGWTVDQYTKEVIEPVLLGQDVQTAFQTAAIATSSPYHQYTSEEVHARHILFSTTSSTTDAVVKAKATLVMKQIKNGADFAKMAKKYGSDSTKNKGGDLGWFGRGAMVPKFGNAVFSMKPNQIQLVHTVFGYHIVQLLGTRIAGDFSSFMRAQMKSANVKLYANVHNPFVAIQTRQTPTSTRSAATSTTSTTKQASTSSGK